MSEPTTPGKLEELIRTKACAADEVAVRKAMAEIQSKFLLGDSTCPISYNTKWPEARVGQVIKSDTWTHVDISLYYVLQGLTEAFVTSRKKFVGDQAVKAFITKVESLDEQVQELQGAVGQLGG